ncbi:hypothetical protein HJD18_14435 [Thermoleophilia bacterium SCSIO 60948]|nr:hypothetical protein HJD18_14435 [Thermoleophilia bacterium SCSIO 60948]
MDLLDEIREATAAVAARARFVSIDETRVVPLARELVAELGSVGEAGLPLADRPLAERAAYALAFDAVNFGSGWWPTIRKRPGMSGSQTMMAALEDHFRRAAAPAPDELSSITSAEVAVIFGQDPEHELMALYAAALRELGSFAAEAGGWLELSDSLGGSATAAVTTLSRRPSFADASTHDGHPVPIFKRAQIAVADLNRTGARSDPDLDRLTLFADNLIPHVLKIDGLLRFDPALDARIDAEELIDHGSREEVEIRAVAIHAVELLAAATGGGATPAELDELLWHRGRAPRYKARPRHRSRTTAY